MKKKTIILCLCYIIPLLLTIGLSSWIISNETKIDPQYNPNSLFYEYLNGQSVVYSGDPQGPSSSVIDLTADHISYKYRLTTETVSNYKSGFPTEVGDYYIYFSSNKDETEYESTDVLFKILKDDIELSSNVTVTYTQFTGQNYFTTAMNVNDIKLNATFRSVNSNETVSGNFVISDESLKVGTSEYSYTFYPTSGNFNEYRGKVQIITYATVSFYDNSNNIISSKIVEPGATVSSDGVTVSDLNGYTYSGNWLYSGTIFDFSTEINDNISLLADYKPITYSIKLYDGPSVVNPSLINTITYTVETDTFSISNPTNGTYYFKGWTLNDTSSPFIRDLVISKGTTGNLNYYANWVVSLKIDTIELDYDSTNRTFANFSSNLASLITNTVTPLLKYPDGNVISDTDLIGLESISIPFMHNGYYVYSTATNYESYILEDEEVDLEILTKPTNVAGSTYLVTVKLANSAYALQDYITKEYSQTARILLKYKTAQTTINGTTQLCTIENAIINGTGQITFRGDKSSATSYVETCFSNLHYIDVYESYDSSIGYLNYTISGRNIIVPYDETINSDGYVCESGTTAGNVFSALTISNYVNLNISESSNLYIGAKIGFAHPNTTHVRERGVVFNDGNLTINSGCNLYAYGYLKSSDEERGLVIINDNATVRDCMHTYDWPGGSTASSVSSKMLPLNAWTMHNISCKMKIMDSGKLEGFFYANVSSDVIVPDVTIIGTLNSSSGLFYPDTEGSYIEKYSKPAENATDAEKKYLFTINGSNQQKGQKDIISLFGSYKDAKLSISASGFSMSTSTSIACPVSYMDVYVKSGGTLLLSKSDFLFLPGTKAVVEQNATLNTGSGVDLSFETLANISNSSIQSMSYPFYKSCIDKYDAKLICNGTFNCAGNLGGTVETEVAGAKLNITGAVTSSHKSLYHALGGTSRGFVGYEVTGLSAIGIISSNLTLGGFTKSSYTSSNVNGNYYWDGSINSQVSINGNFNKDGVKKNTCLVSGTLVTLADGSKKKVEDLKTGDQVLVYNHFTGEYTTSFILYNVHEGLEWNYYDVLNLKFDDGTILRIHNDHYLYDVDLCKYVLINTYNYLDYIGHRFLANSYENGNCENRIIKLINGYMTYEYVGIYGHITAYHLNLFANDLLTIPGDNDPFINIFEMTEEYKYNEELMKSDIEKYGLMDYSELADYIPYEIFEYYQGKYLNIAIGKGYTTKERIIELINTYLSDYNQSN